MRRLAGALCVVLGFATASPSLDAQTFVMPKPEAAPPPAVATPRAPGQTSARQRTASSSPCEQLTGGWVDHRPMNDYPALDGRVSLADQRAALQACEAEQRARPSDMRIAFIFARTLEVNNQNSRATGLYRQLADAGHTPSETQLARAYQLGLGAGRDQARACQLYVDAANAGDAWAYDNAANCLLFLTAPQDPRRACGLFRRAQASNTFQSVDLSLEEYCP